MKKLSLAIAISLFASAAAAQQYQSPIDLNNFGNNLKPEVLERARQTGKDASKATLDTYGTEKSQSVVKDAESFQRRANSIADAAVRKDREELLSFLGLDPSERGALYYFVSKSMPLDMLRSYAAEAQWAGGTLVFRGISDDKDLKTFLFSDVAEILNGKDAPAAVSLDPRLFDTYQIEVVPTIVYTTDNDTVKCTNNPKSVPLDLGGKAASFFQCEGLSEEAYVKISGAVTTDYALRQFTSAGFGGAARHLNALAKGLAMGIPFASGREQVPYRGKWDDFITPEERRKAEDASNIPFLKSKEAIEGNSSDLTIPPLTN